MRIEFRQRAPFGRVDSVVRYSMRVEREDKREGREVDMVG